MALHVLLINRVYDGASTTPLLTSRRPLCSGVAVIEDHQQSIPSLRGNIVLVFSNSCSPLPYRYLGFERAGTSYCHVSKSGLHAAARMKCPPYCLFHTDRDLSCSPLSILIGFRLLGAKSGCTEEMRIYHLPFMSTTAGDRRTNGRPFKRGVNRVCNLCRVIDRLILLGFSTTRNYGS